MVGFSATTARLVRVLPIFGIIILANAIPSYLFRGSFSSGMSFFTLSDWESRVSIFCYVTFIAYVGWCALSHGTSAIAPVAENHSTIRRLVAAVLTFFAVGVGLFAKIEAEVLALILAIILTPAFFIALTEPAIMLPPICKPFLKRGPMGRFAAMFLLPGWPTGVFYTTLLSAVGLLGIGIAMTSFGRTHFDTEVAVVCLSCLGSILLPALLAALFSKQENKRFTNFMIFLVASICLAVAAMIFSSVNNREQMLWSLVWNPPVVLFMMGTSKFNAETLLMAVALVDSTILLTLLGTALKAYGDYKRVFKESVEGAPASNDLESSAPVGS